jgi:hypothetical protein
MAFIKQAQDFCHSKQWCSWCKANHIITFWVVTAEGRRQLLRRAPCFWAVTTRWPVTALPCRRGNDGERAGSHMPRYAPRPGHKTIPLGCRQICFLIWKNKQICTRVIVGIKALGHSQCKCQEHDYLDTSSKTIWNYNKIPSAQCIISSIIIF